MSLNMVSGRSRMASIDAFRGLTILVMIFVNDIAGVKNIPWWMRHMPTKVDGMTFVDVVFPAFLFIVGLSIPFAMFNRIERGAKLPSLLFHVFVRTIGLLIVGVFMVNMPPTEGATKMNPHLWNLLAYLLVIVIWNQYPRLGGLKQIPFRLLRVAGLGGLIFLALTYRKVENGDVFLMRPQWWGILGLIGWAYLTGSIVYLWLRRRPELMLLVLGLLILLPIAEESGAFRAVPWLTKYVGIGGMIGVHGGLTVAGVIVGMLFFSGFNAVSSRERIRWILLFALMLTAGGFMLRPKYGISKDWATPPWALLCAAISCVIFSACYWFMDVRGKRNWAAVIRPAGENPLLAYILAPIIYNVAALAPIDVMSYLPHEGIPGIIRGAVFAFAVVGLTGLLGKIGVRLRL